MTAAQQILANLSDTLERLEKLPELIEEAETEPLLYTRAQLRRKGLSNADIDSIQQTWSKGRVHPRYHRDDANVYIKSRQTSAKKR